MYLSRLEMVGFKSFGLKTDLSFNDGVTAIVGPNGCGKTNIVDAIRWVLGEQKTSMLRADSMEHVIFNGSKNRKPLGMAEVSLTIENNKGILPTEYSQVVITRRLFRSGESQYLLNRTACRLKDIVELFMDTGMGANAYSVIELKMIETILSDKADERRHLFEEAAGVTKYKARRKEAQRKLEAAQKDIARVQDIVREVQKTVNSLARQAEKARLHQEIAAQLRTLDRRVFFVEYQIASDRLTTLSASLEALTAKRTSAEQTLLEHETSVAKAEQDHQHVEQKLRHAIDIENAIRTTLSDTTGNMSVLEERVASTLRAIERLDRENTQSASEQTSTGEQLRDVRSKLGSVHDSVAAAHAELDKQKSVAAGVVTSLNEARAALAQVRLDTQRAQQLHNEKRRELDHARMQAENVQRRIADIEHGLQQLSSKRADLEAQIANQATVLPELDAALHNAEQSLHNAEARQHELRTQQEIQQSNLDALRSTEAHTRASLEFLEGLVDTTESSKFLMNSTEWKPSGEKLTLAEVLNSSDELRVAIEAALGDAARYFVVAHRAEADQAIAALSRNNIGKATFLCRDSIPNVPEPPSIKNMQGIRGWASELIQSDDALRGAVRGILGRTVITDNLDAAWSAVSTAEIDRAVTLAGEVVHRAGSVRGGSTTRTEGVRVGRRERIEQMRVHLVDIEGQVERGLGFAQQLKEEYAAIDLRSLAEVVRQATVSRNSVQQKIDALQGTLAEVTSSSTNHEMQIAALRAEGEAIATAHSAYESDLLALQTQVETIAASVEQHEQHVADADMRTAAANANVREAEILTVRLDGELASYQAEEARLSDQSMTIDQRREQRERESVELASQLNQVRIELEEAVSQVGVHSADLVNKTALRQEAELFLQEAITTSQQANEAVRVHRKELDLLIDEQHALDLQRSSALQTIETLERHASEELEIDLSNPSAVATFNEGDATASPQQESDNEDDSANTPVEELRDQAQELRRKLTTMGNVNFLALEEHERENERLLFMSTQLADLLESERTLTQTILEINQTARDLFTSTFDKIRENFTNLFKVLFSEDDEADLQMIETEDNDPLECKVEIIAKPRGKRPHSIEMLSGGEKTLTAIALLFAIYLVKPSPFCILDEVDAPLDDANIDRYLKIIRKFSANTQFLMITHNKRTMEAADTLYGVTMEEPAVSKVVSVQLGAEKSGEVRAA